MTMPEELNVVGRSVVRSDGVGHVTGRTRFAGDLVFPGMLHLKMVRSPLHHARIRGVDLGEAERVPGFVRALTWRDVPHNVYTILSLIGVEPEEEFVLAQDACATRASPSSRSWRRARPRRSRRWRRCAWTSRSCPRCSTWRRRSGPTRPW